MQHKVYLFLLPLCMALSCVENEHGNDLDDGYGVLVNDRTDAPAKTNRTNLIAIDDVEVLSARKVKDTYSNYFKEYRALCKDWKLNKATVANILENSKIIDGHEYHNQYKRMPCYIIGEAIINCNIKAKYELNAGASAVLFLPDTAYHLGYIGNKHFLIYRAEND